MPLGQRIRRARTDAGLKQVDLATAWHRSVGQISRYERGDPIPVGLIGLVAQLLGVDYRDVAEEWKQDTFEAALAADESVAERIERLEAENAVLRAKRNELGEINGVAEEPNRRRR